MGMPFGRYELLKRIAAGGMGEVYLARQAGFEGFEKLLVVKVLLPNLAEDSEFITMFLDEARIAARLDHPNIGQIYDLGEVDGAFYIAMEYIRGDDVVRLWKQARLKQKPVPMALAARIAADAAAGLDYAHKATGADNEPLNLVHRDVSPQNILVTFDGGVKLIDFGVAKAAGRMSHTTTGTIKGKYAYMSPEQISGADIDHRSDVFALGVVLYEMLTSARLFKRDTEVATLQAVATCDIPPPTSINPKIDPMLADILLKALAQNRDDRYEDAQAFRMALEEWMLAERQPGTAAHLSAYMKELYAERLAEERAAGKPFADNEKTPSQLFRRSVVDRSGQSRLSQVRSASTRSQVAIANSGDDAGATVAAKPEQLPSAVPETKKSPVPLIAGAAIALVLLGAIGAFLATRSSGDSERAMPSPAVMSGTLNLLTDPKGAQVLIDGELLDERTPLQGYPLPAKERVKLEIRLDGYLPTFKTISAMGMQNLDLRLDPDPAKAAPQPPTAPAAPATVRLAIESTPSGAMVYSKGAFLGKTPLELNRPRSDEALDLTLELAGHKSLNTTISQSSDTKAALVLEKLPAAAPKRTPRPPRPSAPKQEDPLDIAIGR